MGENLPYSGSFKIVTVASGKGGVGKTLTTIHMALTLALEGKKAVILDGDLGLSNVDVVLGLQPRYNIIDVIENHVSMEKILLDGPFGIRVIPSGSGITKLADLSYAKKVGLLDEIAKVMDGSEYLLIDTGAGINNDVLHLNSLSDEIVVVTTPEPHAMTDAYAFMKVMAKEYKKARFKIIVNVARSMEEGKRCFEKLEEVASRFLDISMDLLGVVPLDPIVHREVMRQNIIGQHTIRTVSGQAWKNCVLRLLESIKPESEKSKDKFWMDFVLQPGYRQIENLA